MNKRFARNSLIGLAIVSSVMLCGVPVSQAQGMTQQQAQEMLQEMKAIRQALDKLSTLPVAGQAAPPPDDKVNMTFQTGGFSMGSANAPLVIVEYTDLQCPFCQQFHNATFPQIKANYIDTGKVRFVSRDFPLDFHENARRAAVAGRCAGEQDKFWEMRHVMIVNADKLKPDNLISYAGNVKLDVPKFTTCLNSDKYMPDIDKNIAEGTAAGVNGTPSFVIGSLDKDKLKGVRLVGAMPYAQVEAKIEEMLAQLKN